MSKRYVIQYLVGSDAKNYDPAIANDESNWKTVQHPSGGDWMTRSRRTALQDAGRLVNEDLQDHKYRVMLSTPVTTYELTEAANYDEIMDAAAAHAADSELDDDDATGDGEDDITAADEANGFVDGKHTHGAICGNDPDCEICHPELEVK